MKNEKRLRKKPNSRRNFRLLIGICILTVIIIILCSVSAVQANEDVEHIETVKYKYYTSVYIDRDDTLWKIASEHMSDEYLNIYEYMDEVKEINHMPDDKLQYGTVICIPYYSEEFKWLMGNYFKCPKKYIYTDNH